MATLLRGRTMAVKMRLVRRMTRMRMMVGFCLSERLLERMKRVWADMRLPITETKPLIISPDQLREYLAGAGADLIWSEEVRGSAWNHSRGDAAYHELVRAQHCWRDGGSAQLLRCIMTSSRIKHEIWRDKNYTNIRHPTCLSCCTRENERTSSLVLSSCSD